MKEKRAQIIKSNPLKEEVIYFFNKKQQKNLGSSNVFFTARDFNELSNNNSNLNSDKSVKNILDNFRKSI